LGMLNVTARWQFVSPKDRLEETLEQTGDGGRRWLMSKVENEASPGERDLPATPAALWPKATNSHVVFFLDHLSRFVQYPFSRRLVNSICLLRARCIRIRRARSTQTRSLVYVRVSLIPMPNFWYVSVFPFYSGCHYKSLGRGDTNFGEGLTHCFAKSFV
jgi:hypothetical protein